MTTFVFASILAILVSTAASAQETPRRPGLPERHLPRRPRGPRVANRLMQLHGAAGGRRPVFRIQAMHLRPMLPDEAHRPPGFVGDAWDGVAAL